MLWISLILLAKNVLCKDDLVVIHEFLFHYQYCAKLDDCFMSNREIHRMVEWLVSESMVIYYVHLFRDSMWPGGELAKPATPRSETVTISH